MTEHAFADAELTDSRPPLRRALDVLPHRTAEAAERALLDAIAHYEQTRDDSLLLTVTFKVIASARLEASHDFRLAMKQSAAEGEPDSEPEAIDHRAFIDSLRG